MTGCLLLDSEYAARQNGKRLPCERLAEENERLRELVRDMHACIEALCSMVENSPGCSMCLTNQDEDRACGAAELFSRMRELGVEP